MQLAVGPPTTEISVAVRFTCPKRIWNGLIALSRVHYCQAKCCTTAPAPTAIILISTGNYPFEICDIMLNIVYNIAYSMQLNAIFSPLPQLCVEEQ